MPNVAFHHEVLSQVLKNPSAPKPPVGGDPKFIELGAIGPDLYRYIPVSTALATALHKVFTTAKTSGNPPDLSPVTSSAVLNRQLQNNPLMAAYSVVFNEIVLPYWPIFHRDAALLNKLQTVAQNQDAAALAALGGVDALTTDSKQLKDLAGDSQLVLQIIPLLLENVPPIQAPSSDPTAKPWDPSTARPAEFLRWHKTNNLTQTLVSSANTPDQKAYAYGYQCHIASAVAGEPFVNNIVGGPYRTHWWRNRFVSNFVDSWTFGRYEAPVNGNPQASMSGDTPNPPYPSWPDITQSNLQDKFDVAGFAPAADNIPEAVRKIANGLDTSPNVPPSVKKVLDYVHSAITSTYPVTMRPSDFTNDPTAQGLMGLYGVVWFMTSGFAAPPTLPAMPSTCTTPPAWVTSSGSPPPPKKGGPSAGATACGVILSILAVLAFLAGLFAEGAAALAGAIAEFLSGHGIDWDEVKCDVFWLINTFIQLETGLFKSLVVGGFAYPGPALLGTNGGGMWTPVTSGTLGLNYKTNEVDSTPLTKITRNRLAANGAYPFQMDQTSPVTSSSLTADNFYEFYPGLLAGDTTTVEQPPIPNFPPMTTVAPPSDFGPKTLYPELVVDQSPASGAGQALFTPVVFPSNYQYFGDAVSNAVRLLNNGPANLPDYNLDGDRGYGWLNWNPQAPKVPVKLNPGNYPSSGTVVAVQE